MPVIEVGAQIFDLCFAPAGDVVFVALLTGGVRGYAVDGGELRLSLAPTRKSCRALALDADGVKLWAAGRARSIHAIDVTTGKVVDTRKSAHAAPINRLERLGAHTLVSGDDDGPIKIWDTRRADAVREYTHHHDFISDFLALDGGRTVLATSGDGTLSVLDLRGGKKGLIAQSEDMEDELLSAAPLAGGKVAVGTQGGVLAVFDRKRGWGDCVDRILGHPYSVDAMRALPGAPGTVLTGSADGLLRCVQVHPTVLRGALADHGEGFPIERLAVDSEGVWVGSVGHDEALRLTDLRAALEDEAQGDDNDNEAQEVASQGEGEQEEKQGEDEQPSPDEDSSDEEPPPPREKRKRRREHDPLRAAPSKKGKNSVDVDRSFFNDL